MVGTESLKKYLSLANARARGIVASSSAHGVWRNDYECDDDDGDDGDDDER